MKQKIFNIIFCTERSIIPFILRLSLGSVILPHGYLKITDYTNTVSHLTGDYGLPYIIALLVIMIESLGALFLLAGVASRMMAFSIGTVMIGAIPYHWSYGFFMNWFGNQAGEGYEFHLLAIGIALAIVIAGGGKYSIDSLAIANN